MDLAFRRIAIVNRGEPAMRLLHAVRELNQEHGWHLQTIAFYTDPDRSAMFVREADDRYYLGEATYVDPRDGQRKSSYLDYERLKRALVETRADAAWVGWGFVAEHAAFVDLCDELAVNFIGPSGDVMRNMGDKIASKRLAEDANVPVTPWSNGPVESEEQALEQADKLGYPVIIKASAGGGGRGIRRVKTPQEMGAAFRSARSEALKAFGDDTVFMEQMVTEARHIEVQVIADKHGTTWAAGVRDCTIQRRNQKVIEEAPSPILSAEEDRAVREAAKRLTSAAGYYNAGTVECLFDQKSRKFYFMEMNTRLQVEHPVTELATGLDLVKLQLHVASGGKLPSAEPPLHQGHAIEVRLNAEDPDNNFAPSPGRVELFKLPTGSGVRVDTGVEQEDQVPPDFDSMIAKIIAYGRDRNEAIGRLRRALLESAIVIRGGTSNKAFLLELLDNPDVRGSQVDIGWLDRLTASGKKGQRPLADIALVRAAIDIYEEEFQAEKAQFFAGAARGRPVFSSEIGRAVELGYGGQTYQIEIYMLGMSHYRVRVEGRSIEASLDQRERFVGWLTCGGMRYRVISVQDGPHHLVEVDGMSHRISRDEGGLVRAPAPAVVLAIVVKAGQTVQAGEQLLVLEAMKTEMGVNAPFTGKVRSIEVLPNQQVNAGAPLLMLEPEGDGQDEEQAERVVFRADPVLKKAGSPHEQVRELFMEMKRLVLGYDVDALTAKQVRKRRAALCEPLAANDELLCDLENEVIATLTDLLPLFRRESNGAPASPDEYLQSYLRGIDAGRERLPDSFLETLERALHHYDIESLDPTPELKSVLVLIHKSRARLQRSIDQVFDLIERRLLNVEAVRERASFEFRNVLERLIEETHGHYLPLNDLARQLRYLLFDRPAFEKATEQLYSRMDLVVASLVEAPPAENRAAQLEELINCPQPMISFLSRTYGDPGAARRLSVEVMLRRYYRIRQLQNVQVRVFGEYEVATGDFEHQGRTGHAVAVACAFSDLGSALASIRPQVENYPAGEDVFVDVYASHDQIDDQTALAKQIKAALSNARGSRPIQRSCIALVKPGDLATIRYFTFLQTEMGFQEQEILRGLHPMLAERLELWRLENFETKQLRVSDDIYLFHAVARDNPKDERLFSFVEVRDMTPVLNDAGDVIEIPGLEWKFLEALSDIRDFQSRRPPRQRLHWNRVMLIVRPEANITMETIGLITRRLSPAAKTLGLEKVVAMVDLVDPETGKGSRKVIHASNRAGTGLEIRVREPSNVPLRSLDPYTQKVVRMRRFGMLYPYEIVRMLTPVKAAEGEQLAHAEFPPGEFVEYDLDESGKLAPIERDAGRNVANLVIGTIKNFTRKYPEGMTRVICLGDGSSSMGALAEPECVRIIKGLELAEQMKVPFEWFPVSSGAKISMDVGTEGLDWIARVLRKLVEFTQAGGEINVVIPGVNVGGQSYWNAEATMLMHTRGILIMTPNASMVLTGKRALDYSGGVSAEDNQGIGGVERIMGFNGQAQYAARDIAEACHILFRYYDHTYVYPGERWPRRLDSADEQARNVCDAEHHNVEGVDFQKVGDVFSTAHNPGRKKPFDIRSVMGATIDQDSRPLERWGMMRLAETAVVWDAHLGGYPVCMIGIESRPLTRLGFVPGDGPDVWTGGTLFPRSSKKVARAINAASGNRPVVVLANLSGFDGSPESMREWQLEYGAEIGRSVVNFDGPLIFCVISRYHGGAYVVFSCTLNENMQVAALEGSYASVIGGAPAAAVVFPKEVRSRTMADDRVKAASKALEQAPDDVSRARLRAEYEKVHREVFAEKQGEVADYFDSVHNVQRAKDVGSLHEIIPANELRPWLIEAVARGIAKVDTCS
jgi:acetyl/propionyl-CoA carboxylase alpha subunit/acetyl-CoA carboxylase carboxyltransferase component